MGGAVILQFTSASCPPCAAIGARLDRWLAEHPEVVGRAVSMDQYPETAASYGIFCVPAVLVFIRGKLTVRESGCFSVAGLIEKTDRLMRLGL